MIVEKLQQIGLSKKEADLYVASLPLGTVTVTQLTVNTNINRTTAYQILDGLVKKGLMTWVIDSKGKRIKANPPEAITEYLKLKKKEIDEVEEKIKEMLPKLSLNFSPEETETKILYYRGHKGVNDMIWEMLKKVKDNSQIGGYADIGWTASQGEDFTRKLRKEMIEHNIQDLALISDKHDVKKWLKNEQIRIHEIGAKKSPVIIRTLPKKDFLIKTDYYITENEICISTYGKDNEAIGIRILNPLISQTEWSAFQMLWNIATPINIEQ